MMQEIGRIFTLVGVVLLITGFLFSFFPKIPFLGKLPGDIYLHKGNFTFYFPITTSVLISFFISLILRIFGR